MKQEFINDYNQAKKDFLINSEQEASDAIEFVRRLIEIQIDETKKHEPYATNWIQRAEQAISIISDLPEFIEEE